MAVSVFELFKIGIGPSSSHTVGPMRAAYTFVARLSDSDLLNQTGRIQVTLFGSLAFTGRGHGTDKAVMLGLSGELPDQIDPDDIEGILQGIQSCGHIKLAGNHRVGFSEKADLLFNKHETLPQPSKADWNKTVKALEENRGKLGFVEETWELRTVAASPCNQSCPAGINVKGYLGLIAERRFEDAPSLVREKNPFPGIFGRVCPHPCEDACNRSVFGGPVAIKALKRFIADYERRHGVEPEKLPPRTGKKVAVIGAGPAGLTAAADLARANCRVPVFEGSSSPGGMMAKD